MGRSCRKPGGFNPCLGDRVRIKIFPKTYSRQMVAHTCDGNQMDYGLNFGLADAKSPVTLEAL